MANNTLSKVFKGGADVDARGFPWSNGGEGPSAGVDAFRPRSAGTPEPSPPAAAQQPAVDLDAIRKQAFQEGVQAGRNAAEKRLAEESTRKLAELGRIIDQIAAYKPALRLEAEQEVVDLAFAIARRVVRRELSVDRGAVTALVGACIQDFPAVAVKRVLVNPEDLPLVRQALGDRAEAAADPEIPRGGAVLETDQGRLDARIDAQLEEIALGLADL